MGTILLAFLLFILPLKAQIGIAFPGPGTVHSGGGGGGITFKGIAFNAPAGTSYTISTTGTLNIATGDEAFVYIASDVNPVQTVTCGVDSLTLVTRSFGGGYGLELWAKANATANAAATCTANWDMGGSSANFKIIMAANYSGLSTGTSLDQSSCNAVGCASSSTAATARTAQNVSTTTANELLLCLVVDNDVHTYTVASSFTNRITPTTGVNYAWLDKTVSATGTYPSGNCATVNSADTTYWSVFGTFK